MSACLRRLTRAIEDARPLIPVFVLAAVWFIGQARPHTGGTPQLARGRTAVRAASVQGESCVQCHQVDVLFSHPVGITPSMRVPSHLPLTEGKITCLTCHDNDDPAAHDRARQQHSPMLREGGSPLGLCVECHDPGETRRGHGSRLTQAHLLWPGKSFSDKGLTGGVDAETRSCLACHDGAVALDISDGMGVSSHGEHPVGVEFRSRRDTVGRPIRERTFPPAAALDSRIRLFDNRVGCGSCHSPYSTEKHLLVKSNHLSALCTSCHSSI